MEIFSNLLNLDLSFAEELIHEFEHSEYPQSEDGVFLFLLKQGGIKELFKILQDHKITYFCGSFRSSYIYCYYYDFNSELTSQILNELFSESIYVDYRSVTDPELLKIIYDYYISHKVILVSLLPDVLLTKELLDNLTLSTIQIQIDFYELNHNNQILAAPEILVQSLEVIYSRVDTLKQKRLMRIAYQFLLNEERLNDIELVKSLMIKNVPLNLPGGLHFTTDKHKEIVLMNPNLFDRVKYSSDEERFIFIKSILEQVDEIFIATMELYLICYDCGLDALLLEKAYINNYGNTNNPDALLKNLYNYTKLSKSDRRFAVLNGNVFIAESINHDVISIMRERDFLIYGYIHSSLVLETVILEDILTNEKRAKIFCKDASKLAVNEIKNIDYLFTPAILMKLTEYLSEEKIIEKTCYVTEEMFAELKHLRKKSATKLFVPIV